MKKIQKIQNLLIELILADRFMIDPDEIHYTAMTIRNGATSVPSNDGGTLDMIGLAKLASRHALDPLTKETADKYLEKVGG